MSRLLRTLDRDHMLPLFTPDDLCVARQRLKAMQAVGLDAVELTARAPAAQTHFGILKGEFPDLMLGAGTILDAGTARAFIAQGAEFIVSPCLVLEVAAACRDANVPYLPGAGTVREVVEAQAAGASFVKLFPGEVLGTAFVRALRGPLPDTRLLVTGGVAPTVESVGEWLKAGAFAVGLGSALFGLPDDEWQLRLRTLLAFTRESVT